VVIAGGVILPTLRVLAGVGHPAAAVAFLTVIKFEANGAAVRRLLEKLLPADRGDPAGLVVAAATLAATFLAVILAAFPLVARLPPRGSWLCA
jgi:hypothetical protein